MISEDQIFPIKEYCEVIAGQSPKGKFYNAEGEGLPFYQGKKEFTEKYIGEPTKWTSHVTKQAEKGDVLMSVRAPVGPINFATESICIGRGLAAIRASDNIDRDYLFYALLHKQPEITGHEGAVFASINKTQIENIELYIPLLPEQKRIVAILDEAFAGIDQAIANTEKNLAYARELFDDKMAQVFDGITSKHKAVQLGDVIETLTDYHANGAYEKLKEHVELKDTEDYAWMVRSTDFENNFQNDLRFISRTAYDFLEKSKVFGGEIIMSKIGNAGKVYLMPDISRPCSLAMNLFLIRIKEKIACNKYVYRYLKSRKGEAQILSKLKGAATQTITKNSVREIKIPLLPKDDQESLIFDLEKIEDQTLNLERIYNQKLFALNELKQSFLQKAFSGGLTADIADEAQVEVAA